LQFFGVAGAGWFARLARVRVPRALKGIDVNEPCIWPVEQVLIVFSKLT